MNYKSYKIILIGKYSVGKSSLVRRIKHDDFSEFQSTTIGAAFECYYDTTHQIKLNIWDTAGDEKYNSIIPLYYRGSDKVIIVYSKDDNSSYYKGLEWLEKLTLEGIPKDNIVFVMNKNDIECNPLNEKEIEGINYYDISAKTGEGVKEMLKDIIESLVYTNKTPSKKESIQLHEKEIKSSCC